MNPHPPSILIRKMEALKRIHALIAAGRDCHAQEQLRRIDYHKLSRSQWALFASLCYRAGIPQLGLQLLGRVVHPPARTAFGEPRPEEKAEYAACLIRSGALGEGQRLLEEVDEALVPRATLYRAFLLVSRWEYAESIPLLERYIRSASGEPYFKLVAMVNLAAALTYERRWRELTPLLRELLYLSSLRGHALILGRVMEVAGESLVARKNWMEAERFLQQARGRLRDSLGLDEFFTRKYLAIAALQRNGGTKEPLRQLHAIRKEATGRKHWETVRDCDRVEACVLGDRALLARVYFGTPYPSFRARLLSDFSNLQVSLPDRYVWEMGGQSAPPYRIELASGTLGTNQGALKPDSLPHRLLAALCSDFYRPLPVATAYVHTHRGMCYRPHSSPQRVYDTMARLRKILTENAVPLEIIESGGYRLVARAPVSIVLSPPDGPQHRDAIPLSRLKEAFAEEPFSIRQASELLASPRRSLLRTLGRALEERRLERSSKGKSTRYRFID